MSEIFFITVFGLLLLWVIYTMCSVGWRQRFEALEQRLKELETKLEPKEAADYGTKEAEEKEQEPAPLLEDLPTPPPLPELAESANTQPDKEETKTEAPAQEAAANLPPPPPQSASALRRTSRMGEPREASTKATAKATAKADAKESKKAESSPAPTTIPWRRVLEAAQLLPPENSGDNTEVRLAVWWTTRIGAILLVIAGVFLGVYVSQDSPLLRLLCLAAISGAVVGIGLWLEHRYQAFGRIVASGGLGLCFVTAFAASAFETTRVIESAPLGVLVQLLAIVGMIVWSLWKNDAAVATMALICGYVACAFSHSHDLAYFVVAGLLLFGAAGSSLLVLRRWRPPAILSLAASWAGFIGLILFDWRLDAVASRPAALTVLVCLVLMTFIFQIAGLVFRHRHPDLSTSRRLRIGTLVNTSLAVVSIYLAGRLVYPDHLAQFYLTFAVLVFGFSAWHWRSGSAQDRGLARALFLKSMALLALFFVAQFDGPVRWLSLSLETATLVYVWQRHRTKWFLLAVAVGMAGTLGWMWLDLLRMEWPEWSAVGVRNIVGGVALLILTACLALQTHYANDLNKKVVVDSLSDLSLLRFIGALGIVSVAVALAFLGKEGSDDHAIERIAYLSVLAPLATLPLWRWRAVAPIFVCVSILIAGALAFFTLPWQVGETNAGIVLGVWLSLLAFAGAEAAWRLWPKIWFGGDAVRGLGYGFGLPLVTAMLLRFFDLLNASTGMAVSLIVALSIITAAVLLLQARPFPKGHSSHTTLSIPARWLVSVIGGLCLIIIATSASGIRVTGPFWLGFAALLPLAIIYRSRDAIPAAAAAIALISGWAWYSVLKLFTSPSLSEHLVVTLGLIAINSVIAWCLCRADIEKRSPTIGKWEAAIHAASLTIGYLFCAEHFTLPTSFAAATVLAVAALAIARLLPFRHLAHVSLLSVLLATIHQIFTRGWKVTVPDGLGWWFGIAGLLTYLIAFEFGFRRPGKLSKRFSEPFSITVSFLTTVAALVVLHSAIDAPWQPVGYLMTGLIGASLWRFWNFPQTHRASVVAIVFASVSALLLSVNPPFGHQLATRVACSFAAAGILGYGLILFARQAETAWRQRSLVPAIVGSLLAFWIFTAREMGVENLTTVCWGLTAIVVFSAGLAGGLRNYRLVGLVGLGLCLIRMFLVDIDDTLYRIIAFFAISLVLLLIGFLYHRFRHLIEAFDGDNRDQSSDK